MKITVDIQENVNEITGSEFVECATVMGIDSFQEIYTQECLKRVKGIYCFLDKHGNPLYLGKSINLHARIKSHLSGTHSPMEYLKSIVRFIGFIVVSASDDELTSLETRLICQVRPLFNGGPQSTRINYRYSNLRQWLNDIPRNIKMDYAAFKVMLEEAILKVDGIEVDFPMKLDVEINGHITDIEFDNIVPTPIRKTNKREENSPLVANSTINGNLKKVDVIKYLLTNLPTSKELDYVLSSLVGE